MQVCFSYQDGRPTWRRLGNEKRPEQTEEAKTEFQLQPSRIEQRQDAVYVTYSTEAIRSASFAIED